MPENPAPITTTSNSGPGSLFIAQSPRSLPAAPPCRWAAHYRPTNHYETLVRIIPRMNTGNASSARGWRHRLPASGELGREWKVLLAGFCGNALGVGALLYFGLGSFIRPLEQTLGWTRLQINLAATVFTLTSMVALPVVGRLCDTLGPRRVAIPSIVALALGLAAISIAPAGLWVFYALIL